MKPPFNPEPLLRALMSPEAAACLAGDLEERFVRDCRASGMVGASVDFVVDLSVSVADLLGPQVIAICGSVRACSWVDAVFWFLTGVFICLAIPTLYGVAIGIPMSLGGLSMGMSMSLGFGLEAVALFLASLERSRRRPPVSRV
jgi:hypothetical protein